MNKNGKRSTHHLKPLLDNAWDSRTPSRCKSVSRSRKMNQRRPASRGSKQITKQKTKYYDCRKATRQIQLSPLPSRSYIINDRNELQIIRHPDRQKLNDTEDRRSQSVLHRLIPKSTSEPATGKSKYERSQSEMRNSNKERGLLSNGAEVHTKERSELLRVLENMTAEERTSYWPERGKKTTDEVWKECQSIIPRNWRVTRSSIAFDLHFGPPRKLPRHLPRLMSTGALEEYWQATQFKKEDPKCEEVREPTPKRKKAIKPMTKRAKYERRRNLSEARRRERERQKLLEEEEADKRAREAYERERQTRQKRRREMETKIIEEQLRERQK